MKKQVKSTFHVCALALICMGSSLYAGDFFNSHASLTRIYDNCSHENYQCTCGNTGKKGTCKFGSYYGDNSLYCHCD